MANQKIILVDIVELKLWRDTKAADQVGKHLWVVLERDEGLLAIIDIHARNCRRHLDFMLMKMRWRAH